MPEDPSVAEPEQREHRGITEVAAVQVEQAHGVLVVQQQRNPSADGEHRQGRDERDDSAVGDRDGVDRAEGGCEHDSAER